MRRISASSIAARSVSFLAALRASERAVFAADATASFSFFTVTDSCLPTRLPSPRASATSSSQLNASAITQPRPSSLLMVRSGRSGLQQSSLRRWSNTLLTAWIAPPSASWVESQ
eukprot:7383567-Prymnesium_polylepis.2